MYGFKKIFMVDLDMINEALSQNFHPSFAERNKPEVCSKGPCKNLIKFCKTHQRVVQMSELDFNLNLVFFRQEKEGYWIWISCPRRVWDNWRLFWPALSKVWNSCQSYFYKTDTKLWYRVWANRKTNRWEFQISGTSRLPSHWLVSFMIRNLKKIYSITYIPMVYFVDFIGHLIFMWILINKHGRWKKLRQQFQWYFVTIIVLTYCEKKLF